MMRRRPVLLLVAAVISATSCTGTSPSDGSGATTTTATTTPTRAPVGRGPTTVTTSTSPPTTAPTSTSMPTPSVPSATRRQPAPPRAEAFDVDTVLGGIRALAAIGPRDAAGPASDRAAAYVAGRLRAAGYRVTLQPFPVPAGVSWGVRVPAGTTLNVVADPPGLDPTMPHVVVGAHLDTVPQAPGAE